MQSLKDFFNQNALPVLFSKEWMGQEVYYNNELIDIVEDNTVNTTPFDFGIHSTEKVIFVKKVDVSSPKSGDKVEIDNIIYAVSGDPLLNVGVWTLNLKKNNTKRAV